MSGFPKSKIQNPKSTEFLFVITGPTASGKSGLAMELAERFGGEIICADSRTVYRGMDIGTAKPTREDQRRVPHHLLDVADPDQRFTAADFQVLAGRAIDQIRHRGHVPFVVGGTGLYIDGLVLGYQFGPPADAARREALEQMTIPRLQALLKKQRIALPHNRENKRYLIRAIEQHGINDNRGKKPCKNIIVVSIATEKHVLEQRIRDRANAIFADGIVAEAAALASRYGWEHEALTGNIYPIVRRILGGEIDVERAKELFIIKDRQLAKKQLTWLRRHDYVKWLTIDQARDYLTELLESPHQ